MNYDRFLSFIFPMAGNMSKYNMCGYLKFLMNCLLLALFFIGYIRKTPSNVRSNNAEKHSANTTYCS